MADDTEPKRKRGRPTLTDKPGERFMIHLPPKVATLLRGAGEGSLSLGIIRLADVHQGIPLTPTPVRTRRRNPTATARRRAIAALEDLKQKLLVEP